MSLISPWISYRPVTRNPRSQKLSKPSRATLSDVKCLMLMAAGQNLIPTAVSYELPMDCAEDLRAKRLVTTQNKNKVFLIVAVNYSATVIKTMPWAPELLHFPVLRRPGQTGESKSAGDQGGNKDGYFGSLYVNLIGEGQICNENGHGKTDTCH